VDEDEDAERAFQAARHWAPHAPPSGAPDAGGFRERSSLLLPLPWLEQRVES